MHRSVRVLSALCALSLMAGPAFLAGPVVRSADAHAKPPAPPEPPPDVPLPPFPPGSPPGGGGHPYRGACPKHAPRWCARTIAHFCYLYDCSKKSRQEIDGATPRNYRRVLNDGGDAAFKPPWLGRGFTAHHIVAQTAQLATFARAVLKVAGVNLNSFNNLIALRGTRREKGTPGYDELRRVSPGLAVRMAHVDTTTDYYYQVVNYQLAAWVHRHNEAPRARQADNLLNGIKRQLALGGGAYLAPGRVAH